MKTTKRRNLYFLGGAFFKIIDAFSRILTLGFYFTDFEYRYVKRKMF
jgi:hypothetical protein